MSDTNIQTAALRQLRNAGFKFDDPDIVGLLDLSDVSIVNGRALIPHVVIDKARAAHPDWFAKAATEMTAAEVKSSLKSMAEAHGRELAAAETREVVRRMRVKFGLEKDRWA